MATAPFQFEIVLVFFIYGLAFFCMGLLISLETRRSPLLAEGRVLVPLAVFGYVHGTHEWIEMAIIIRKWFQLPVPGFIEWLRLGLLVVSFSSLIAFGVLVLISQNSQRAGLYAGIGGGLLGLYLVLVFVAGTFVLGRSGEALVYADVLARYILAVPGALLAALGLAMQARHGLAAERRNLAASLRLAAWGFAVYGLTQLFVVPLGIFPAQYINSTMFLELTGVPIQVVRALLAILITVGMIRASQIVEDERQQQFISAQHARVEALEQVQQELVKREALRQDLLRHIVIAQEEERTRIARELHDDTAQLLTALSLNLATLKNSMPDSPNLSELLTRLQSLLSQMSQGIYRMVRDLRPVQLDDLGLVAALQYLAEDERQRTGLQVSLDIATPLPRLDPLVETVLFRVAQAALTNVALHAHCNEAKLRISTDLEGVVMQVEDSGAGFDPQQSTEPRHGFGLAGMRERAASVGGKLTIQSAPGKGTLVETRVPLQQPETPVLEELSHEYHPLDAGR